ncbi:Cell adhesion molecule 4 [Holothuria leucospilota]|uniref:Cell adhesion molecule 4 n=1 Tax=Holothuria leucospilota TaxID=206669 RepID=A0A9Q1BVZ3_HOLLE|nr:Cell adhesion molecule 4 [Holothuria leucospilota]
MLIVLKWMMCTTLSLITISRIVNASLQVHSKINDNVSLRCASVLKEFSQDLSLQWKKGPTLSSSELLIDSILGNVGGPYSKNDKYILNVKDGTLKVKNLSLDDDGNYFCELLTSPYSVSNIKLTVTVPLSTTPIIDVCGRPGNCNFTTLIGEEVSFTCLAVLVRPAVELLWKTGSMAVDGSQNYTFSNNDGTFNVSNKIHFIVRNESVITCEAVVEAIRETLVNNVATIWIQVKSPFAEVTQTPHINLCGGNTNCTVFFRLQDTVYLICSLTVKDGRVDLHWINESSIIDSQSYSREEDDSGKTTIFTTLQITFYQPILLSCRSQYSKDGHISSWVQLERNAEISTTVAFLDEPYSTYLIAAVGAAVLIIFLIVCFIGVIRIRKNNSAKNKGMERRRKLSPYGMFRRRGFRLQKCVPSTQIETDEPDGCGTHEETVSLREQQHLEISMQGRKKKEDWRQQNAFDES